MIECRRRKDVDKFYGTLDYATARFNTILTKTFTRQNTKSRT